MIIALTGTPGCGKTTVSKVLKNMGYSIESVDILAERALCVSGYDKEMDSKEIDLERLNEYVKETQEGEDLIIEGHLSHLLSVDMVIILRCDPLVLRKRLTKKGWKDSKVKENVEAEILDVIKVEAHEEGHTFYEIDSTSITPEEVADEMGKILKGGYKENNINWLEKYEYLLFE